MFHCLPNVIETSKKKCQKFFLPNSGHTRGGGGGQDGKWSHFPPFFLTLPLKGALKKYIKKITRFPKMYVVFYLNIIS